MRRRVGRPQASRRSSAQPAPATAASAARPGRPARAPPACGRSGRSHHSGRELMRPGSGRDRNRAAPAPRASAGRPQASTRVASALWPSSPTGYRCSRRSSVASRLARSEPDAGPVPLLLQAAAGKRQVGRRQPQAHDVPGQQLGAGRELELDLVPARGSRRRPGSPAAATPAARPPAPAARAARPACRWHCGRSGSRPASRPAHARWFRRWRGIFQPVAPAPARRADGRSRCGRCPGLPDRGFEDAQRPLVAVLQQGRASARRGGN